MAASPWSVKGIEPETREAAKFAARRAGVTLGTWLNHVVRGAATNQLTGERPAKADPPATQALAQNGVPTGFQVPMARPEAGRPPTPGTVQVIFETLQKLVERIEAIEESLPERTAPLSDRMDRLSGELGALRNASTETAGQMERAIARLSERIARLETAMEQADDTHRRRWFRRSRAS